MNLHKPLCLIPFDFFSICRHAYSITGFFELERQDRKKVQLVRVSSPQGNEDEWKGAWGDKDKNWRLISYADKQKLKIKKKDEGEFFMAFGDFLRYFGELEVVHVRPDSMVVEGGDAIPKQEESREDVGGLE